MKTTKVFTVLMLLLFTSIAFAGELEDVYKEQWNKYNKEKLILTISIRTCEEAISDFHRYDLDRRRAHNMPERVALQGMIDASRKAVVASNMALNGGRGDQSSIRDIEGDVQLMKKRSLDVDDKLLELKIKIVKEFGNTPDWCK